MLLSCPIKTSKQTMVTANQQIVDAVNKLKNIQKLYTKIKGHGPQIKGAIFGWPLFCNAILYIELRIKKYFFVKYTGYTGYTVTKLIKLLIYRDILVTYLVTYLKQEKLH